MENIQQHIFEDTGKKAMLNVNTLKMFIVILIHNWEEMQYFFFSRVDSRTICFSSTNLQICMAMCKYKNHKSYLIKIVFQIKILLYYLEIQMNNG